MTSESISKGMHYKKYVIQQKDVGQPIDPAFIVSALAESGTHLSLMQSTILKKVIRLGGGGKKTPEEDLRDIIGAAERELSLLARECDNETGGLGEHGFFTANTANADSIAKLITENLTGAIMYEWSGEITPSKPKKGFVATLADELLKLAEDPGCLLEVNIESIAEDTFEEVAACLSGKHPSMLDDVKYRQLLANTDVLGNLMDDIHALIDRASHSLTKHISKAAIAVITENAIFRALHVIGEDGKASWLKESEHKARMQNK